MLTQNEVEISDDGKVNVDTFSKGWYQPKAIIHRLKTLFPNSEAFAINQFPSPLQNVQLLERSINYDDVIFVTYADSAAYIGRECLTSRIVSVIQALQVTNRVSTVVHFGNPFVLEELEHIPRILIGGCSLDSICCTLDVLAGKYPAKGHLPFELTLN